MSDDNFEELSKSKRSKQFMMNMPNYDILTNNRYCDKFFYSNLDIRVEQESSDFIFNALNLGEEKIDKTNNRHSNNCPFESPIKDLDTKHSNPGSTQK